MIIRIDPAFERRIPKLRPDELEGLERSLIIDGCLEPLTVWRVKSKDVLLDGHNRYRLCKKNNIVFTTNFINITSREEAFLWIDRHQLGRRNLNDTQRTVIANRIAEYIIAANKRAPRVCLDEAPKQQNTREDVAKEANVPIRKLREVREVVRAKPELEEKLLSGEVSLIAARKEVRDEQKETSPSSAIEVTADNFSVSPVNPYLDLDDDALVRELTSILDVLTSRFCRTQPKKFIHLIPAAIALQDASETEPAAPSRKKYGWRTKLRASNLHKQISNAYGYTTERERLIQKLLKLPVVLRRPHAFEGLAYPHMVTEEELRGLEGKPR